MKKLTALIDKITDLNSEIPLIAITGICKNAGKTTFLNWLTASLSEIGKVALLTTGRDGEDYDLVGGHEKPKVFIPQNTIFVTHSNILGRFSGKVEILAKSDYKAGSFNIWVAKALQNLETEIVGPSTASEQINLTKLIKTYQPRYIIIDGSLDRKAITLKPDIDAMILVVSANYGSLEEIERELKRLLLLTEIPKDKIRKDLYTEEKLLLINKDKIVFERSTLLGFEKEVIEFLNDNQVDQIYIPGVVTNSIWTKVRRSLISKSQSILLSHPYQLHLSLDFLNDLINKVNVKTINPFIISGIAINSFSIKGRHIEAKLLYNTVSKLTKLPIIDCMEVL